MIQILYQAYNLYVKSFEKKILMTNYISDSLKTANAYSRTEVETNYAVIKIGPFSYVLRDSKIEY